MKLTKREKILGLILVVLVFVWIYLNFVYSPLKLKVETAKREAEFLEKQVEVSRNMIENGSEKEKELMKVTESVEKIASPLFSSMYQEKVIYVLSRLVDENEIVIKRMNFIEDIFQIDKEMNSETTEAPSDNAENENIEEKIDGLEGMEVSVPFTSSYDNARKFIREIRNYEKFINIVGLELADAGSELVNGNITLRFYSYPVSIIGEDEDSLLNEDKEDYFVVNPFSVFPEEVSDDIVKDIKSQLSYVSLDVVEEYVSFNGFEEVVNGVTNMDRGFVEVYRDNESTYGSFSNSVHYRFPETISLKKVYLEVNPFEVTLDKWADTSTIDIKSLDKMDTSIYISYYDNSGNKKEKNIVDKIDWNGWRTISYTIPKKDFPIVIRNIIVVPNGSGKVDEQLTFDNLKMTYQTEMLENISEPSKGFTSHKVVKGDTLYSISKRYYGTGKKVDLIKKYNNLPDNNIKVGKSLVIPNDVE